MKIIASPLSDKDNQEFKLLAENAFRRCNMPIESGGKNPDKCACPYCRRDRFYSVKGRSL